MRRLAVVALAGSVTLLTSCAVGPNYVKPAVEVPAAYKELEGWKVAQPRDGVIRGAWWEIFGDPELSALEAQVEVSNQNVAVADVQLRQARALVQAARASYFPTVTGGVDVTRSRQSSNLRSAPAPAGTHTDYTLPIDVTR